MPKAAPMPCDVNAALASILALRRDSIYQAAELLRQQQGAEWMAEQPQDTQAYGAVRLLIGTWESIAMQVLGGCPPADAPFFEANPVGYMWDAVKDGVKVIRDDLGPQYASNFEMLNRKYRNWLNKQSASYRTGALDGINAQFG